MAFETSRLNSLYRQHLGRDADQPGIDYWKNDFGNIGWEGIENSLKQSDEAKKYLASQQQPTQKPVGTGLLNPSAGATKQPRQSSQPSGFDAGRLNQIYQQHLGRDADQAGADYWRDQFSTLGWGGIESSIKQHQSVGPSSNDGVFDDVMNTLMEVNGAADSDIARQWSERIRSGQATLDDMRASLQQGGGGAGPTPNDYSQLDQLYQQILGRPVDQAGADYWLNQVGQIGWDGVAEQMRQGGEYQTGISPRFTPTPVQPNQTAAGQLEQILSSDSPLMQRAATQGQQFANNRGLLNSSMASGAAQGAMIDRATPIAQQDAQTHFSAAQADSDRRFDMQRMQAEYGFRGEMAEREASLKMNELFATSNANAWGVMANNLTDLVGQASATINQIQMNPDIPTAEKEKMIQQVIDMRDTDIKFQQGLYDELSQYLLNTGAFGGNDNLTTGVQSTISQIYRNDLGREPDPAGVSYWAEQSRTNGWSTDRLRSEIIASANA